MERIEATSNESSKPVERRHKNGSVVNNSESFICLIKTLLVGATVNRDKDKRKMMEKKANSER